MNKTEIKKFLGLTMKEVNELLENNNYITRQSEQRFVMTLNDDGSESEILLIKLAKSHFIHDYFDKNGIRYYPDYWTNYYIREDKVLKVQVYDNQLKKTEEKTSQAILDKYNIKQCSICGCYEPSRSPLIKHQKLAEHEGKYYCPECLPSLGLLRCDECGKAFKKEDIVDIHSSCRQLHSHNSCSDCLKKNIDNKVVAKCEDGEYYTRFITREGKNYPESVFHGYDFILSAYKQKQAQ